MGDSTLFSEDDGKLFASYADSFDRDYGVDTEGADHNNYGPVRASVFDEIMQCAVATHDKQWFIDIGSGKGRALLMAAQYRFQKVIGVEKCGDFCEIANKNIARAKKRIPHVERITIVCLDAFEWLETRWPEHGDLFLFLYCPFDDDTFRERSDSPYAAFLQVLAGKAKETRTHITLAFVNPPLDVESHLTEFGFERIRESESRYEGYAKTIYCWKLFEIAFPFNGAARAD